MLGVAAAACGMASAVMDWTVLVAAHDGARLLALARAACWVSFAIVVLAFACAPAALALGAAVAAAASGTVVVAAAAATGGVASAFHA